MAAVWRDAAGVHLPHFLDVGEDVPDLLCELVDFGGLETQIRQRCNL